MLNLHTISKKTYYRLKAIYRVSWHTHKHAQKSSKLYLLLLATQQFNDPNSKSLVSPPRCDLCVTLGFSLAHLVASLEREVVDWQLLEALGPMVPLPLCAKSWDTLLGQTLHVPFYLQNQW